MTKQNKSVKVTTMRKSVGNQLEKSDSCGNLTKAITRVSSSDRLRPRILSTEGAQIVELAVALPLLLVLVVGITDFAGAFNLKNRLNGAVREGARFASTQSTEDLTNVPLPSTITAVRDVIDSYLAAIPLNDCGLSTTSPTNSGLTWTYTASSGCAGTLTLTINRGQIFQTAAANPVTVEATHITISYPYQWRFNGIITLLVPSAGYQAVTQITTDATMQNIN